MRKRRLMQARPPGPHELGGPTAVYHPAVYSITRALEHLFATGQPGCNTSDRPKSGRQAHLVHLKGQARAERILAEHDALRGQGPLELGQGRAVEHLRVHGQTSILAETAEPRQCERGQGRGEGVTVLGHAGHDLQPRYRASAPRIVRLLCVWQEAVDEDAQDLGAVDVLGIDRLGQAQRRTRSDRPPRLPRRTRAGRSGIASRDTGFTAAPPRNCGRGRGGARDRGRGRGLVARPESRPVIAEPGMLEDGFPVVAQARSVALDALAAFGLAQITLSHAWEPSTSAADPSKTTLAEDEAQWLATPTARSTTHPNLSPPAGVATLGYSRYANHDRIEKDRAS